MIIKQKYIIAHTPNLDLRWATEGRREARNRARNVNNQADPPLQMPGADFQDDLIYSKMS
jgi:hypothetical protein